MSIPVAQSTPLITALEQLGPHNHLCSIYESQQESFAVAIPFIRIGLDRGEKCIYIADDATIGDVSEALTAGGIDVDRAIASKALVLTTKEQIYLEHGSSNPDWVFTFWKEATELAMSEGFSALRFTGESEWVPTAPLRFERWMEYESRLTHALSESNCSALCQYNLRLFPPEFILDVLRTHPIVIYRGRERHEVKIALEKAFEEIKMLEDRLHHENLALREEVDRTLMFDEIVGSSPAMRTVLSRVAKVAPMDSTVLITGETGTGKELIARAIHKRSRRAGRAFVAFNCAGIPPSLIASELFGHERGSFTGAQQRRLGRFELAEGGTIFLDEVGELPAETQVALLRVLQEREFERVGGSESISTDVRIIAATNRDLQDAVAAGTFRLDLFYRLNVFPIEVPPLRGRKEDIPMLLEHFIKRHAIKAGKRVRSIDKKTIELFKSYHWPGNIRELQSVIERTVIVSESEIFSVDESWLSRPSLQPHRLSSTLSKKLLEQERNIIESALAESKGRISGPTGAAVKLGMPSSTLESKIKALKIRKNLFKSI